jgi:hypothetical protein
MIDKKTVPVTARDPNRIFTGHVLDALLAECVAHCSHPICDYSYLSLDAHHVVYHARGGLTRTENGLLLCPDCHRLLHDGFIPQRLVFAIKDYVRAGNAGIRAVTTVSAEELIARTDQITIDAAPPSERFTRLNDILIAANFLPSCNARYYVFVHVLLAKASILSDGTSPLRSSLRALLVSMMNRRKWAQILAAKAARYAEKLKAPWLKIRAMHSRAVGYNARNRFRQSVTAHRQVLSYLDSLSLPQAERDRAQMLRGRILREMGVCMAKASPRSREAQQRVQSSLGLSQSLGEPHDIDDALIRCCESLVYLDDIGPAESYLDQLYGNWSRMDVNLRAITMKLHAKIALARNDIAETEEMIHRGSEWCALHGIHHQAYHFARLRWHLKARLPNTRERLIT